MNIKNHSTLIGRLTRDFKLYQKNDVRMVFGTIAVKTGEKTDFFDFKMFLKSDKSVAYMQKFGKGDLVGLTGRLTTYTKDNVTTIQFLAESLDPTFESSKIRANRKENAQAADKVAPKTKAESAPVKEADKVTPKPKAEPTPVKEEADNDYDIPSNVVKSKGSAITDDEGLPF